MHDVLEVLRSVVDDDVRTEVADPFDVAGSRRGRHASPEVLGQLNRDGADAARAGLNEHLLARLEVRPLDERLPGGQSHEGHGSRLGHREAPRLGRKIVLVHGDALGEGADATVARPPVDLVTRCKARHSRPDAGDHAGEVVPEDERRLVGEDQCSPPESCAG